VQGPQHLPPTEKRPGSAWLVVVPIGLAVILLGLVTVGLREAGGPTTTPQVVEIPSRVSPIPGMAPRGTPAPGAPGAPGAPAPGANTVAPGPTKLDLTTLNLKVSDLEGRFGVTVPRSWTSLPATVPDSMAWAPVGQAPNGEVSPTPFRFVVQWFASNGCALDQCAEQHAGTLTAKDPAAVVKSSADTLGARPAVRLDVSLREVHFVAFVVVEGDRFWVVQLRAVVTVEGFDQFLSAARPVLATMSFG